MTRTAFRSALTHAPASCPPRAFRQIGNRFPIPPPTSRARRAPAGLSPPHARHRRAATPRAEPAPTSARADSPHVGCRATGYAYPLAAPYRGSGYPDDIVWLAPHAREITTWRFGSSLLEDVEIAKRSQSSLGLVPGENIPAIGDFNGDGRADIMWQGVSNQAVGFPEIEDVLWLSRSTDDELAFAKVPKSVGRTFRPFVGDFDGDGIDDIFWHRSWGMTTEGPAVLTTDPSYIWYFDDTGGHVAEAFTLEGDYSPYVGDFDADGCHDIAWFDTVGDALHVWRCMPGARDFDCGDTAQTPPNAAPVGMHWGF